MNDESDQIRFREMLPEDIDAGLGLCRVSRWNQLRRDWEALLRFGSRGCLVATRGDRVIGTITTVGYQDRTGQDRFHWIGMVMVDPAERRKGLGSRLLREALGLLGGDSTVRLDATPAGRPVYLKLNFADEYGLKRMETVVPGDLVSEPDNPARPMTGADLQRVIETDYRVFGADRGALLKWLFDESPGYAWVISNGGQVLGYTFGRKGFNCEQLGPVIAETQDIAKQLVVACLRNHRNRPFILDVLDHGPEWTCWLESTGFREQRPFMRMVRGENRRPGLPEKQFAILGPELG